jgi:8-hydroxy-5-deazaflavin:NADPH oxidoreductase
MKYSVIGSGSIGKALARRFSRSGIELGVANTRGAESLVSLVNEFGNKVIPLTVQEAVAADLVILAVPYRAHPKVAKELPSWAGKVVVDAMNAFNATAEELGGKQTSDVVASAFKGAKVVKAFNQLPAKLLAQDPGEGSRRRVMFVSGNDQEAEQRIVKLVGDLGFAAIALGRVDEGGKLLSIDGPLILQNLIKHG